MGPCRVEILDIYLHSSVKVLKMKTGWVFLHDNDLTNYVKRLSRFWSGSESLLNGIENLWKELEDCYNTNPTKCHTALKVCMYEWTKIATKVQTR